MNIGISNTWVLKENIQQLPESWTFDKLLKKHPSQPYNPDIANAFFRAGLIEPWERGIDVMVQACRKYGSPEPVLCYEDSGFRVEFPGRDVNKSPPKSSEKILKLMQADSQVSVRHIAEQLGVSPRAVEKQIAQLKTQGRLIRVGSAKGGHWEVFPSEMI